MHDCLFDSSLANHKLSYISKYISITYALDSVHEKIDVRTEADLLPFYPTSPGLYIRASSRRTSPASLPGFAGYFHCFTSQDMSRR